MLEEYFQGNQRDSLQSSFSCTKSVVSLLVGIAIEEGLIDSVGDSITKYVDGLRPEFEDVTVRHLLTMTSGISDTNEKLFGAVPAPWSDEVKVYYDPHIRRLATTFSLDHVPGERFEYHDFSPILIGMMLENVTDRADSDSVNGVSSSTRGTMPRPRESMATRHTLSEYLSDKIWQPAGMQYSARWSVDSNSHGFEKTAAGLHARAIDWARLGALLIDPQQTLISLEWLQQSVLDQRASALLQQLFEASADRADARGASDLAEHIRSIRYGFYWWGLEREGRYDFYANGHYGQFIYVSPAARLVICRTGTGHGGLNDWNFGSIFFELASDVIAAERQLAEFHPSPSPLMAGGTVASLRYRPRWPLRRPRPQLQMKMIGEHGENRADRS